MSQHFFSISQAIDQYLDHIKLARSLNTHRTYKNALRNFLIVLELNDLPPDKISTKELPEDAIAWFAYNLKEYAPSTERLYLTAVKGFYEYLVAEQLSFPNLPRVNMLIRQRARRPGFRLPQFPEKDIDKVLVYANNIANLSVENQSELLRNLRDRAFLLTLADTGLRVHEACGLRRGDLDWNEGKALIVGKGDQQALIRFSTRTLNSLKDYLSARAELDGASGKPLKSLPLFSRHDRGAGKKIKPITTATGRNIVSQRVKESLGEDAVGTITPHSFRHYFVTTVLKASGNLKLAQKLARHMNIAVTQRYAHLADDELDIGYWEIFEEH